MKRELQPISSGLEQGSVPEAAALAQARLILQTAIGLHESSFTPGNVERVGEYSIQQVRDASFVVFQNLFTGYPEFPRTFLPLMARISLDSKSIWVSDDSSRLGERQKATHPYTRLVLEVFDGKQLSFDIAFPLIDPTDELAHDLVYRTDERNVHLPRSNESISIDDFQFYWRGTRTLFANMLHPKRLILPEQLDHLIDFEEK